MHLALSLQHFVQLPAQQLEYISLAHPSVRAALETHRAASLTYNSPEITNMNHAATTTALQHHWGRFAMNLSVTSRATSASRESSSRPHTPAASTLGPWPRTLSAGALCRMPDCASTRGDGESGHVYRV